MNEGRLKWLEQYAKEYPNDPFNLYALALEYQQIQPNKTEELLAKLTATHPDYLPTYYALGKALAERGETEQALEFLGLGRALAGKQNNRKTMQEIQSMIDELNF